MTTAYDFSLKTISGKDRPLADYKGRVLLVVNVASKCGYTPQYKGLEALHRRLVGRGLAVLGVPCNQFGAQEPGSETEIEQLCTSRYDVTFDLFSKVDVNGPASHPLYAWLEKSSTPAGDVKWNFAKFLVGKDGKVLARFGSDIAPDDKQLLAAIESGLTAQA